MSEVSIIAVGRGGYDIAMRLKKFPIFSDAMLIVCDVSDKFIKKVSSKVHKAFLLPELMRDAVAEDAVLAVPVIEASRGDCVLVASILDELTGCIYAPLISLCALMHRRNVYSSFSIGKFTQLAVKAMLKVWCTSNLSVRQYTGNVDKVQLNHFLNPFPESTALVFRLVTPKLLQHPMTDEEIQKYIPKEYSNFIYVCQRFPDSDLTEIYATFNSNQYNNNPMKTKFTPKHEADNVDRLINLYGRHLPELYDALQAVVNNPDLTKKPALPLMLCPINDGKDWAEADLKIMIFGRETNNWNNPGKKYYNFNLKDSADILAEIESIQEIYNAYFNFGDGKKSRFNARGPERFISGLKSILPGKKIEYLWNNICKIGIGNPDGSGKCCGLTPEYIYNIEFEKFNVVKEEIEILKPDVLIFMTGRENGNVADRYIAHHLGDVKFEQIDQTIAYLHKIEIPGVKYSVRIAQHPSRSSNEELDKMYAAIINDMKHCNII